MVQPQCVVCGDILANESLNPSKLKKKTTPNQKTKIKKKNHKKFLNPKITI